MGHFVYVHSQWVTTLQCNVVSHWLGAYKNDPCTVLGKYSDKSQNKIPQYYDPVSHVQWTPNNSPWSSAPNNNHV